MIARVRQLIRHTADLYTLVLERGEFKFSPGHHVHLGFPNETLTREYSIASGPQCDSLNILFKLIPQGALTPRLAMVEPGQTLEVRGPYGEFLLDEAELQVCIATGTGLAPFFSYVDGHSNERFKILHGVSHHDEALGRDQFSEESYAPCVSQEDGAAFHGRVTDYLRRFEPEQSAICRYYICGRTDMIHEVFSILTEAGVPRDRIKAEIYY